MARWEQTSHPPPQATGQRREDYLRVAEGVIRYFLPHQASDGRILDPYENKERQYATPAFACAASVLTANGRKDLAAPARRAAAAAAAQLVAGQAADRHGDFFTVLLMHVIPPPAETLAALNPLKSYRDTGPNAHNWNVVAVAGEFLRGNRAFVDQYLPHQLEFFTPHGMYRDPNDPLAYDLFPRLWLTDMLAHGLRHPQLEDLLYRGAWTSLFLQSPTGELPAGGRSGAHQWNEAQQAATFEMMARLHQDRGDLVGARAFKRAAHLSLASVRRWVRPTGELFIVKNRFDPALRHGYETYSFHSQYNLLAAAMLAMAFVHADESIAEGPSPSETGGFALALEGAFHKAIANAGGLYVEVELRADPHYQATGIIRVHHRSRPPAFPLPDAVTRQASYGTGDSMPSQNLALGPEWKAAGTWRRLADVTDVTPVVEILEEAPQQVRLAVTWPELVRETLTVTPDRLVVEDQVLGPAEEIAVLLPFLTDAGENPTRYRILTPAAGRLTRLNLREPNRYGFLDAWRAVVKGSRIACELTP